MKVWVVTSGYDREGETPVGVAATPERGRRMAAEDLAQVYPSGRYRLGEWAASKMEDGDLAEVLEGDQTVGSPYGWYVIREVEVEA